MKSPKPRSVQIDVKSRFVIVVRPIKPMTQDERFVHGVEWGVILMELNMLLCKYHHGVGAFLEEPK